VISDRDLHANTSNGLEAKKKVLSSHHWTSSSTKRHCKQQQQQQKTNYTSPQLLHSHQSRTARKKNEEKFSWCSRAV
jgi:hypothetical protein